MRENGHPLDALVAAVLGSAKYKRISRELVASVGAQSLARQRSFKDAVKETKSTLHQVAGAFLPDKPDYDGWLRDLERAAGTADGAEIRRACVRIMRAHASTRERLALFNDFYGKLWQGLPPVRSVLDIACGLHPLAIPWMGLPQGGAYHAYDIYDDMVDFLDRSLPLLGVQGQAHLCDVCRVPIRQSADLALVLKALPTLERLDKFAGLDLLRTLDAPYILVSFPARSLGGKGKGMARAYEERFTAMVASEGWAIQRFSFTTELVFRIQK